MKMKTMAKPPRAASYDTPALRSFLELGCAVEGTFRDKEKFENSLAAMQVKHDKLSRKPGNRAKRKAQCTRAAIEDLLVQKSAFNVMLMECDEALINTACLLTQEVKTNVGHAGVLALQEKALFSAASANFIKKTVIALVLIAAGSELVFGAGMTAGIVLAVIAAALHALERNFLKDALCLEKILEAEKIAAIAGKG